jgi:hypothetical protein
VPPRPTDELEFAFKFRAGPNRVPVVTAYVAKERKPAPGAPGITSRPAGYAWAKERAEEILVRERPWWEQTDMDAVGVLLDGLPSGSDIVEDMIGHIRSGKLPGKDNLHYARYVIPYVRARRDGKAERAAIDAAHATLGSEGRVYARSTVETEIKEAKRRGLDKAAFDVLDANDGLTPDAVLLAARLPSLKSGEFTLAPPARCILHLAGSLDPAKIAVGAKARGATAADVRAEANKMIAEGRHRRLPALTDDERAEVVAYLTRAEQHTAEAGARALRVAGSSRSDAQSRRDRGGGA